jgi:RNA polymerase sigma-70 factor (ECF subfamily)
MDARSDALVRMTATSAGVDLETVFNLHYGRIARVITRVIKDPGRAEEIAVDAFLKWSHHPSAHGDRAGGWLYRTAVRMALDELRRQTRRSKAEWLLRLVRPSPTPEELACAKDERERVRCVLASISRRRAELLLLRSDGLSYAELASVLKLQSGSVGTLLTRAQQAFRKEYVKRYGDAQRRPGREPLG